VEKQRPVAFLGAAEHGTFRVIDAAGLRADTSFVVQGSHFVGTTAVGVKVLSANFIRMTVPAGTSSRKISFTNAGGTTTGAKLFTVQ